MYGKHVVIFSRRQIKDEGVPLWKTDESHLRYYNITPTFILEVKLRVFISISHTMFFPVFAPHFFPLLRLHELRFTFCVLTLCSHAHSLTFLSRLLIFFYSVFSEERSNGLLAESSSQDFLLFFALVRPSSLLVTNRPVSSAVKHVKQSHYTRPSENSLYSLDDRTCDASKNRQTSRGIVRGKFYFQGMENYFLKTISYRYLLSNFPNLNQWIVTNYLVAYLTLDNQ